MEATKRAINLESTIRDIAVIAKKVQAKGKKMHWFNIGDPNKFDFDTPDFLKEKLVELMNNGSMGHYSNSQGDQEYLESIAERENKKNNLSLTHDDIVASNGISEGLMMFFGATVEEGDEVLIPGPAYPMYIQLIKYFGGKPVSYQLVEEENWEPSVEDLRKKVTEKTKIVCVINPNNPTGVNYKKKTLKEISEIAAENDLILTGDEIYDQLIFDEKEVHSGLASVSKESPNIIFNGFSKAYLIPGWRAGYMYFNDPEGKLAEVKQAIVNEAMQRLSAITPMMKACAFAYKGPQGHIKKFNKKLNERGKFAYKRLNEIERIETQKPEAAFYIFPKVDLKDDWKTDREFVEDVVRNAGLVLPHGSGFDPVYGKNHFRSVILPTIEEMEEAFGKLDDFLRKK
jgi:alanine-synthesizing transaminase